MLALWDQTPRPLQPPVAPRKGVSGRKLGGSDGMHLLDDAKMSKVLTKVCITWLSIVWQESVTFTKNHGPPALPWVTPLEKYGPEVAFSDEGYCDAPDAY